MRQTTAMRERAERTAEYSTNTYIPTRERKKEREREREKKTRASERKQTRL